MVARLQEAEARAAALARENGALKAELDRLAHQVSPSRSRGDQMRRHAPRRARPKAGAKRIAREAATRAQQRCELRARIGRGR